MRMRVRNGFTLLELLLAISILSLITGSILGGLHLGRRAWEASRASETLDEVENALRAVAGLFARAYPVPIAAQDATSGQVLFNGEPGGCRFIMLSEGGAQWGGLIVVEVGGESTGQSADLVVWTKLYRGEEGLGAARSSMTRTVALKGLVSFQLSYFGVLEQGKPPRWSDKWSQRNASPLLIGVKIGAQRFGRVIELETTVATRQQ